MAKESGIGATVAVDDAAGAAKTITNDITSLRINTERGTQEISGLDAAGTERLLLLGDANVEFGGVVNLTAGKSHDVFKTVSTTSVARTTTITISGQILAMELLFTEYVLTRNADGSQTWRATGHLADGTEPTWST